MTAATSREDHLAAGFAALAVCIHLLESAVPMILPGVKPGLANVVVLIVLLRYGFRLAASVTLLRVVIGATLLGTLFTPTFFLSLAGALASLAAAGAVQLLARRYVGAVGTGAVMAMAHMSGQFLLAWLVFVPHPALVNILPVLLAASLGLGIVTGIIAASVLVRLPTPTS